MSGHEEIQCYNSETVFRRGRRMEKSKLSGKEYVAGGEEAKMVQILQPMCLEEKAE